MRSKRHVHDWAMFLPPRKGDPESFIKCLKCDEVAYLGAEDTKNFILWKNDGVKGMEIRVKPLKKKEA